MIGLSLVWGAPSYFAEKPPLPQRPWVWRALTPRISSLEGPRSPDTWKTLAPWIPQRSLATQIIWKLASHYTFCSCNKLDFADEKKGLWKRANLTNIKGQSVHSTISECGGGFLAKLALWVSPAGPKRRKLGFTGERKTKKENSALINFIIERGWWPGRLKSPWKASLESFSCLARKCNK